MSTPWLASPSVGFRSPTSSLSFIYSQTLLVLTLVEPVEDFLVTQGTYLEDDYPYTSGDTEVPGANCLSSSNTVVNTNDVAVTGVRYATNDDSQS